MATRTSLLRYLAAALVAGFAISLMPTAPAFADEDPGMRRQRVRAPVTRVRAPVVRTRVVHVPVERVVRVPVERVRTVVQVRTVERVRNRTQVVCYDYTGQPFDCRGPAPVAPQPVMQVAPQPVYQSCGSCAPAPQVVYQAPAMTTCGNCARAIAAPRYYGSDCGGCTQSGTYGYGGGYVAGYGGGYAGGYGGYGVYRAAPYRWAARYGYRQGVRHAWRGGY